MLKTASYRVALLAGVSHAALVLHARTQIWVERVAEGFHLPAGAYRDTERGLAIRRAMPAPPPVPFVWMRLVDLWGGAWRLPA
jgi:hypothetical protein